MNFPNIGLDSNFTYYEHNISSNKIPNVFIHGVGLDNEMWEPQKIFFEKEQVVFYDLFNHGKSKKGYELLNFDIFIGQLKELLSYLKINKCNLIGFSLGALIAQHFAIQYSEKVNKLVLIGSVYDRNKEQVKKVQDRYQKTIAKQDIVPETLARWFTKDYLEKNPNTIKIFSKRLYENNIDDFHLEPFSIHLTIRMNYLSIATYF